MNGLVDTHCHVMDRAFESDRSAVLDRARRAGVHALVLKSKVSDVLLPWLSLPLCPHATSSLSSEMNACNLENKSTGRAVEPKDAGAAGSQSTGG